MKDKKINYRYLLIIIGAGTLMFTYSIGSTALSFFVAPVTEEFGYTRSLFTLYYSIITIAGVFGMPVVGKSIHRFGVRKVNLISGISSAIGLIGFSLCNSLISFYLVAAFFGFFKPAVILGDTVLIDSWFSEKKGTVLGIVMAGSGVGGVLVSLIVPWSISISGWRRSYILLAILQLILTLIATLLIKDTPQSIGLQRYGQVETYNTKESVTNLTGISYKNALKMPKLYIMYLASVFLSIICGFQQHMPAYFSGLGLNAIKVGSLVSVLMLSMTFAKIIIGLSNDKLGSKMTNFIIYISFFCSFIILIFLNASYPMLLFSMVLFAFGYGSMMVFVPLVTRDIFGEKDFPSIYGITGTAMYVGMSIGTPLWGGVYDITKSYNIGIIASAILIVIIILMYSFALNSKEAGIGSNNSLIS